MMYPFLTLNDGTEIVHSEMLENETVKVYIEKPDEKDGFHYVSCFLPDYGWTERFGFSDEEMSVYEEIIKSTSHLILQFAKEGGFDSASNF